MCLGLRMMSRLNIKNDMPLRDNGEPRVHLFRSLCTIRLGKDWLTILKKTGLDIPSPLVQALRDDYEQEIGSKGPTNQNFIDVEDKEDNPLKGANHGVAIRVIKRRFIIASLQEVDSLKRKHIVGPTSGSGTPKPKKRKQDAPKRGGSNGTTLLLELPALFLGVWTSFTFSL
nr:hypothetical protein [Tanacetum cinerariifolium]